MVAASDFANQYDDVSNNDNKEEVVHSRKRGRKTKEKIVCPQQLKDLLLEKFSYGLRVDSFIDMSRLRGYAEEMGISITENEEELKAQIIDAGILSESKVYFFSSPVGAFPQPTKRKRHCASCLPVARSAKLRASPPHWLAKATSR